MEDARFAETDLAIGIPEMKLEVCSGRLNFATMVL
jgi:hypothetical protein